MQYANNLNHIWHFFVMAKQDLSQIFLNYLKNMNAIYRYNKM